MQFLRKWGAIACAGAILAGITGYAEAAERLEDIKRKYVRPATVPHPASNPWSAEKEALGRALFFDPILSGARVRSCATCHSPGLAWGDGLPLAVGENQKALALRSPTVLNLAWIEVMGWDGKFPDLEAVAFTPIAGKGNMNADPVEVVQRVASIPGYRQMFGAAFTDGAVTQQSISLALAAYQRTIVSGEASFDRWISGDEQAISESAKKGFAVFNGKGKCAACHAGWSFTDGSFHDIGLPDAGQGRGRLFPNSVKLQHAFKTPTLRSVAQRYPYMHNGSIPTLEAVVEHYDRGGIDRPSRSQDIKPLALTFEEKSDLIAFMKTLSGKEPAVVFPILPR